MKRFRTLGIAGLVSALVMIPLFALAEAPSELPVAGNDVTAEAPSEAPGDAVDGRRKRQGKRRGKRRGKRPKFDFPMAGAKFKAHVNKRITRIKARIERRLEKKNVPKAKRAEILSKFSKHALAMRAAAQTAAADGQVTKEEAKRVRKLARTMRKKMKRRGGKRGRRGKSRKN